MLADRRKVDRIIHDLEGLYDSYLVVYLVASHDVLRERSRGKYERGLLAEYQLLKLRQIEELPFAKIDTTDLDPEAVASEIKSLVSAA